jgi:DNA polymerase (family 10)
VPGVTAAAVGGSLRRMRDTIGDIDLLVAAEVGRGR